ncbi:hypothetical protein [Streptomyces sp. I5]|uniref:hypothetical protein n=1 Tax=Streptomyces sp. I5 TaxID=2759947 RepID=UPI0035A8E991
MELTIVYYSSTCTIAEIAKELRDAGTKAGAEVRLAKAAEWRRRSPRAVRSDGDGFAGEADGDGANMVGRLRGRVGVSCR